MILKLQPIAMALNYYPSPGSRSSDDDDDDDHDHDHDHDDHDDDDDDDDDDAWLLQSKTCHEAFEVMDWNDDGR